MSGWFHSQHSVRKFLRLFSWPCTGPVITRPVRGCHWWNSRPCLVGCRSTFRSVSWSVRGTVDRRPRRSSLQPIGSNLVRVIDKATSEVIFNGSIGDWFRTTVGVRQGYSHPPCLTSFWIEPWLMPWKTMKALSVSEAGQSPTFVLLMTSAVQQEKHKN